MCIDCHSSTIPHLLSDWYNWFERTKLKFHPFKDQTGSYPAVLQVLDISSAVTILHSSGHDPEAFSTDCINYRTSIREEMDAPDDQHAAMIGKPARRDTRTSFETYITNNMN